MPGQQQLQPRTMRANRRPLMDRDADGVLEVLTLAVMNSLLFYFSVLFCFIHSRRTGPVLLSI